MNLKNKQFVPQYSRNIAMVDVKHQSINQSNKISNYIMFTSTLNTDTQGVMGVTRGGQVSYHGDSSLSLL
jgi:lipoate-protein ligase B